MFSSSSSQVSTAATYIEDVFSTYLYTGNGSTQTITNGIDLSGKGGLVWVKWRSGGLGSADHNLYDTSRGALNKLLSNSTSAQINQAGSLTAFNSTGFSLGSDADVNYSSAATYASWTFRKQAKFFDIVTYTGNGVSNRTVSHSLGSVPGCIFFKITSTTGDWVVLHQNNGTTPRYGYLNLTSAMPLLTGSSMSTFASSATFSPGALDSALNLNGATYVAYLFAHDAGGFGASGSDNVISCGSFTGNATITLGYEPQWVLLKQTDVSGSWILIDTMRGWTTDGNYEFLAANNSNAASSTTIGLTPTATGMVSSLGSGSYIYIAIRRGPMKTPTSGTSVYTGAYGDNNGVAPAFNAGFPVDLGILAKSTSGSTLNRWAPRLTQQQYLASPSTAAEATGTAFMFDYQSGWVNATTDFTSAFSWMFRRAPGFFDVVCYRGNGVDGRTINHNLTVSPELTIIKMRSGSTTRGWRTYTPGAIGSLKYGMLDLTNAFESAPYIPSVSSTTVTLSTDQEVNGNNNLYVAYLFATVAGVSKVGSYTGSGTTKQIDCGFTGGARFVLIKRTDSTGDWYVWDSARGIVAGNDPYLLLNSTAAEVTSTDYVDTYSAGFEISSTAPAAINANGGSFIFLAIA